MLAFILLSAAVGSVFGSSVPLLLWMCTVAGRGALDPPIHLINLLQTSGAGCLRPDIPSQGRSPSWETLPHLQPCYPQIITHHMLTGYTICGGWDRELSLRYCMLCTAHVLSSRCFEGVKVPFYVLRVGCIVTLTVYGGPTPTYYQSLHKNLG